MYPNGGDITKVYYRMLTHQTKQYITHCHAGLSFDQWIPYLERLDFDTKRMADLLVILINLKLSLGFHDSFKKASNSLDELSLGEY